MYFKFPACMAVSDNITYRHKEVVEFVKCGIKLWSTETVVTGIDMWSGWSHRAFLLWGCILS